MAPAGAARMGLGDCGIVRLHWQSTRAGPIQGGFRNRRDALISPELHRLPWSQKAKSRNAPGPQEFGNEVLFPSCSGRQQRQ